MRADGHSGLFEMQGRREVGISAAPASQKEKGKPSFGVLACMPFFVQMLHHFQHIGFAEQA